MGVFSTISPTALVSFPTAAVAAPTSATTTAPHLNRVVLAHRLGNVPIKEASIVIAVSSAHRREAFAACEWILEAVKRRAEIWKREEYADARDARPIWKANFPVDPRPV